ncbi:MAG: response regulator [Acidobacteriota bacterium]
MSERLRVLLIEDDEDDYILVRSILSDVGSTKYDLTWVEGYDEALDEIKLDRHDVYLLDYRLGDRNGLELLQEIVKDGACKAPIIFLTGQGSYNIDIEAMRTGAADFLVKGQINAHLLERSIRYAIERKKAEESLKESERQLKFLSSQLLTVQESERKRIAAELHDNLGQILTAVKFGVENTLSHMEPATPGAKTLEGLVPTIQYAIEEVRRIYTHLRPSLLDDLGILATIGWFCREFQKVYSTIRIEKRLEVQEEDIPESLKVVIYRVMQEAMNNLAKYSGADTVNLSLVKTNQHLELTIRDNGCGFDPKETLSSGNRERGLGLASMMERAKLSGGDLTIESAREKGTVIHAFWPA